MSAFESNSGEQQVPRPIAEARLDAPKLLVNYLRSQLEAAYKKERSDDETDNTALNGSFYQHKILLEPDDSPIIKATTRIIMQPPFSHQHTAPSYEFAEIYAIFLRGKEGSETNAGELTDQFLVRTHDTSGFSPFVLVEESGCTPVDLSDMDVDTVLGIDTDLETITDEINDIFTPVKIANDLLNKLSTYNIVASKD